jgi:hypothetical protein
MQMSDENMNPIEQPEFTEEEIAALEEEFEQPDQMAEESAADDGVEPGSDVLTVDGDTVTPVAPQPAGVERTFVKIGGTRIELPTDQKSASTDEIKKAIQDLYPEIKHSEAREAVENGVRVVQYSPKPGTKG